MFIENVGKWVVVTHHAQGGSGGLLAALVLQPLMDEVSRKTGACGLGGEVTCEHLKYWFLWRETLDHQTVDTFLEETGKNPKVVSVSFQDQQPVPFESLQAQPC